MKHISIVVCALLAAGALMPVRTAAQGQPNMYGPTITADQAKTVAAAAVAEAKKNQWTMAVAIVDTAGDLVYFEKMDNTQVGQRRRRDREGAIVGPIQAADQGVSGRAGGRRRRLAHSLARRRGRGRRRAPAVVGGKIIGAIGASGGAAQQDGVTAAAGAATLK